MRLYCYVGPKEIADRVRLFRIGMLIRSPLDVAEWIASSRQEPDSEHCVTATFVVDEIGQLRVADRHSEHVACAGGAACSVCW
jgi:hypothetical protein